MALNYSRQRPGVHYPPPQAGRILVKGGHGFHRHRARPRGALRARTHAPFPPSRGQRPYWCPHTSCDRPRPSYHETAIKVPPKLGKRLLRPSPVTLPTGGYWALLRRGQPLFSACHHHDGPTLSPSREDSDVPGAGLQLGGVFALRAHCALFLDYVLPEEPPSTPLGNALRIK